MDELVRSVSGGRRVAPPKVLRKHTIELPGASKRSMPDSEPFAFDASLVRHVQSGDRAAFCKLVQPHELTFYKIAWGLTASEADAEKVARDGVARAWREFKEFSIGRCFRSWMAGKTLNAVHAAAGEEPSFETVAEYTPSYFEDWQNIPATALEDRGFRRDVHRALTAMPTQRRELFVLRDMAGFDAEECSSILKIELRTVKAIISWARLQFRDELALVMERGRSQYASGGGQ